MTDFFAGFEQEPTPQRRQRQTRLSPQELQSQRRRRVLVTFAVAIVLVGGVTFAKRDAIADFRAGEFFPNPFAQVEPEIADYEGPGSGRVEIEIPAGASGAQMASVLYQAGVVASPTAFTQAFAANPDASGIQPGVYEMYLQMRAEDAVSRLLRGERLEVRVPIPEGFTLAQIVDRLEARTHLTRADIEAALAYPETIGLPEVAGGVVEGWLFPATYEVRPTQSATDVLSAMVRRTIQELDRIGVPEEDRHDTIIKASIVEREAPGDDLYRGKVARVILNRLATPKPLGMDAIDAFGAGRPAHLIPRADFQDTSNPWASRVQLGLPPTAIGSPGAAALEAAFNPPEGPWIWFVTVNLDTGETIFTDNYSEFLELRRQYQEWAREHGF